MTEKACGFVAVIGPPNAGKSTLSMRWLGRKFRLSHKKHRPRACGARCCHARCGTDYLVDTPGIFAPSSALTVPW